MHGTIRFHTDSDDLLVRTSRSITAAIAGREASLVPGLHASTMAGQLIVQATRTPSPRSSPGWSGWESSVPSTSRSSGPTRTPRTCGISSSTGPTR